VRTALFWSGVGSSSPRRCGANEIRFLPRSRHDGATGYMRPMGLAG